MFDDGTASNDYEYRKTSSNARQYSNTSQHFQSTKSNHGASNSDQQLVAPVEIPLEDPEEPKPDSSEDVDSSFFGKISEFGRRAKRQWFPDFFGGGEDSEKPSSPTESTSIFDSSNFLGIFGSSGGTNDKPQSHSAESESENVEILKLTTPQDDKYRNKRSTSFDNINGEVTLDDVEDADEENITDQPESQENTETDEETTVVARKPGKLQHLNSDDEDYISEAASGSGMESRTILPTLTTPSSDRQPSKFCTKFCRG